MRRLAPALAVGRPAVESASLISLTLEALRIYLPQEGRAEIQIDFISGTLVWGLAESSSLPQKAEWATSLGSRHKKRKMLGRTEEARKAL